jgi:aldose 1-epimerase
MSRIVLDEGGVRVELEPRLGAGIAELSFRVPGRGLVPLMAPKAVSWFNDLACYMLAPWSNRIAHAEFDWRGTNHRLNADWPDGTAIHGLVKDRPWRIEQRSPVSALLSCTCDDAGAFPWAFRIQTCYVISATSLVTSAVLTHEHGTRTDPMPAGLGFHPFWQRSPGGGQADVTVRVPGLRQYPHEHMIPTGPAVEDEFTGRLAAGTTLDDLGLDDVFTGSTDGAVIEWPRVGIRVRYRCSPNLGHTVVYTGMPDVFCLEPVSMVNDGFNRESRGFPETGVHALAPGESMRADWSIEIDTI